MNDRFTRREFLRRSGIAGISACGLSLGVDDLLGLTDQAEAAGQSTLAIASKGSVESLVKKAVDGLGGIEKFVKKGSRVVIKPNLAWARTPGQAATTNPQIVSGLVKLCKSAGARSIVILDHSCDTPSIAFKQSGAQKVASALKVKLVSAHNHGMYRKIGIPKGKILKSDECVRDVLDADVFINVPIAKVHSSTLITASMKNLMGVTWNRQAWHNSRDLEQCIADYSTAVKPDLVVLDAVRVLLTRGPKGPGRTKDVGQVIASTDPAAIDAYAATLLGKNPRDVRHLVYAAGMGVGEIDLKKVNMRRV